MYNLYRFAAGEKNVSHSVLCLAPLLVLLDRQNFLADFLRAQLKRSLFNWSLFVGSKMAFIKASMANSNLDSSEYIKTL